MTAPRIVVGVSDSPSGRAALHTGVALARERGADLELVRVWRDVGRLLSLPWREASLLSDSQRRDQELLDECLLTVRLLAPEVSCTVRLTRGELYDDLCAACRGADLLVVGVGDPQGSSHLIGEWFVKHAPCPVLLVEPEREGAHGG